MRLVHANIVDSSFSEKPDMTITISGGRIAEISEAGGMYPDGDEVCDLSGLTLIPGFIDLHVHGAMGADTSDGKVEGLKVISSYLASKGVTSFCPTTMMIPKEAMISVLAAADKFKKELSDSGRAAGERGSQNQGNNSSKPVFKFQPTLQQEFRKQKISPNAAQGEDENAGNGLRNLGKLFAEKAATISPNIKTEAPEEESKADTSVSDEAAKRPIISSGNGNKNSRHNNNRNRNKNRK